MYEIRPNGEPRRALQGMEDRMHVQDRYAAVGRALEVLHGATAPAYVEVWFLSGGASVPDVLTATVCINAGSNDDRVRWHQTSHGEFR